MANLFEGLDKAWLDTENPEDITPDIVRWIHERAPAIKRGIDAGIDMAGRRIGAVTDAVGLTKPMVPKFVDADGNVYNAQTGELIERPRNTYAEGLAEQRQREIDSWKPEYNPNFQRPKTDQERFDEIVGTPSQHKQKIGELAQNLEGLLNIGTTAVAGE